jgi:IS30 family transposase
LFTIAPDNGKASAMNQEIIKSVQIDFYIKFIISKLVANENLNLNVLKRQYSLKSISFEEMTAERILVAKAKLNNRSS